MCPKCLLINYLSYCFTFRLMFCPYNVHHFCYALCSFCVFVVHAAYYCVVILFSEIYFIFFPVRGACLFSSVTLHCFAITSYPSPHSFTSLCCFEIHRSYFYLVSLYIFVCICSLIYALFPRIRPPLFLL